MSTATENKPADSNVIDGAITEVKPLDNALVVTNPEQYAKELFAPFNAELATAKRKAAKIQYDVKTAEGMEQAKDLRTTFVKIRTSADKLKTERKRPIDQAGKAILAGYNALEAAAKAEEAKHDKAIRDEEARIAAEKQRKIDEERERVEALQRKVDTIRTAPSMFRGKPSTDVKAALEHWSSFRIDVAEYQDHVEEAITALNATVDELRSMVQQAEEREAEQARVAAQAAELARLKAEQAERERVAAAEAAERARLAQAERDKAEAERLAAAAREAEQQRQMEAMQAEQAKQQQIMRDIQAIQQRGQIDGDARTLLNALTEVQALELDPDYYGGMHSMATMAQSMAASRIGQKYGIRLIAEIPAAHEEALAEKAQREMVEVPLVVEGQPVQMGADLAAPDADLTEEWINDVPGVVKPDSPSTDRIVNAVADLFIVTPSTAAAWLLDLDQLTLVEIKVGAK